MVQRSWDSSTNWFLKVRLRSCGDELHKRGRQHLTDLKWKIKGEKQEIEKLKGRRDERGLANLSREGRESSCSSSSEGGLLEAKGQVVLVESRRL